MYYKVIKDDKIIDVLDEVVYLKYQEKHGRMIFCDKFEAQAIFSSDRESIWHEESLYNIPVSGYDTVRLEEIDEYEYRRLKVLNCGTVEDITDEFVMSLLVNGDTGLLEKSLRRLYISQKIDKNKVIELSGIYSIAEDGRNRILKKED